MCVPAVDDEVSAMNSIWMVPDNGRTVSVCVCVCVRACVCLCGGVIVCDV